MRRGRSAPNPRRAPRSCQPAPRKSQPREAAGAKPAAGKGYRAAQVAACRRQGSWYLGGVSPNLQNGAGRGGGLENGPPQVHILKRELWLPGLGWPRARWRVWQEGANEAPRGAGVRFRGSLSPAEGGRQPASSAGRSIAPASSPPPLHCHPTPFHLLPKKLSRKRQKELRLLLPLRLPYRLDSGHLFQAFGVEARLARSQQGTPVSPFRAAVRGAWPRGRGDKDALRIPGQMRGSLQLLT